MTNKEKIEYIKSAVNYALLMNRLTLRERREIEEVIDNLELELTEEKSNDKP